MLRGAPAATPSKRPIENAPATCIRTVSQVTPMRKRCSKSSRPRTDILSNQEKRAHFDRGKASTAGARSGKEARFYSENPFESFLRHRRSRRRGGIKVRGADVTYTLTIGFLDSARGTTRRVDMTSGKRLEVRVPAGTDDGQVLRLQGQGMTGMGGGDDGDALVTVQVEPDGRFRRDGDDIHVEAFVTLPEASSVLRSKCRPSTAWSL